MPTIKLIDGIKVNVYGRDHLPPHFHVVIAEYEEIIEINTLNTYNGFVPAVYRRKVINWASKNQSLLNNYFFTLNPRYANKN